MLLKSVLLIGCGFAGLYFYTSLRVRELAIAAARKRCVQESLQLLDQSVSMRKVRLGTRSGVLQSDGLYICRHYDFEFTSTRDERYRGDITMHGNRIAQLQLQPHRMPESSPDPRLE